MSSRDINTPLVVWICAAICAHYMMAEGGDTVATIHEDRSAILTMASHIRQRVRTKEQTFEVSTLDVAQSTEPPPNAVEPPRPKPKDPAAEKKAEEKAVEKKAAEKKVEEKKVAVVAEAAKVAPPPEPQVDKRIAVKQHAKPNQADNPTAHFLGDEANHVTEESVATQTSHDRDDPDPTPGGNHAGPKETVGDSDRTKIADSEEHPGEKDHAPGEKGTEFDVHVEPHVVPSPRAPQPAAATRGDGKPASVVANAPLPPQVMPGGPGPGAPEVNGADGTWSFNPIRPGAGTGTARDPGPGNAAARAQAPGLTSTKWLGLGGTPGPGMVNLNLTHEGIVAAVGSDQLRREREADGERRRSEHRGAFVASSFERWRSAIENYVSSVKPGNQTALNTAASPFATYLVGMHNRIHPIFADSFLGSLESLPKGHPLSDLHLVTRLEIVLTREGRLSRMGIVRPSGVTAFDIAALDSVQRASPFGPAPNAIISPDGNVYLHWEFHRDEVYACSTMNARPFLLNVPPPAPPVDPNPAPGKVPPTRERGVPEDTSETRHGALPVVRESTPG